MSTISTKYKLYTNYYKSTKLLRLKHISALGVRRANILRYNYTNRIIFNYVKNTRKHI